MKHIFLLIAILYTLYSDAQVVNRFRDSTNFYGSVRMDSIVRITKGAVAGRVLTSDANGTATWQPTSASAWSLTGNSSTIPSTNYIGTSDSTDLRINTNGSPRIYIDGSGNTTIRKIIDGNTYSFYLGDSLPFSSGKAIGTQLLDLSSLVGISNTIIPYTNPNNVGGSFAGIFNIANNKNARGGVRQAIDNPATDVGYLWSATTNVVGGLSYGVEAFTDRGETDLFITDNAAAHDIGRIDIHADNNLGIGSEYVRSYIVDLATYTANPNHGMQQFYMDSSNVRLQYKASHGSYVYADSTAPTSVEIDESFKIIKPESLGTVFWVDKDGKTTATDFAVVDGTEGNGKVLTSDANGNASWSSAIYGSYYDTLDQVNKGAAVENFVHCNSIFEESQVSKTNDSTFTISVTGVYEFTFIAQVSKTDGGTDDVRFYLRKNGDNLPFTSGVIGLANANATHAATWMWQREFQAGDTLNLLWQSEDVDLFLDKVDRGTTPNTPAVPSVTISITKIK